MRPRKDEDALVDVLDVIIRDGVVLRADVVVSIAEIPLLGIKLTALVAGMERMNEYGLFEEWDTSHRNQIRTPTTEKRSLESDSSSVQSAETDDKWTEDSRTSAVPESTSDSGDTRDDHDESI